MAKFNKQIIKGIKFQIISYLTEKTIIGVSILKKIKLIKTIILSYILFFVQLNITILPFKYGVPDRSFVEVRLTHSGVYAQMDSMTSKAKSESNDFKRHYLPMIVMLGIGTMSFFIFKNLERRSPDMIIFLIGGIIYFANVVMGWTEENEAFEELPDDIVLESQAEALELQKKSFEDVLKIAEKRFKMQMAATATFAAASISAMMMYMKERQNNTQAQSAVSASISDAQSACMRDPQVASGQWLMASTREPLLSNCQRQTTEITTGLTQVQTDVAAVGAINERVADPRGSSGLNGQLVQTNDQLAQHAASVDHPVEVDLYKNINWARMTERIDQNYINRKKSLYFEDANTGIVYEMIPRKLNRESDENLSYMERYFTDEELKDFSKEEISFLNFLKIDMNLIDMMIAQSHAGWGSWIGIGKGAGEAAVDTASTAIGNEVGAATSTPMSEFNCTPGNSQCGTTSSEAELQESYVQLAGAVNSAAVGEATSRATQAAAQSAAKTSAWRSLGRLVAKRAAQVVVVAAASAAAAAAGGAIAAAAPVVITAAGVYLTAKTAYDVTMAGVAVYEAYTKNSMAEERLENTVDDMGDFSQNMAFIIENKSLLDLFVPQAFAFSGLDVANNGRQALAESTGDGMKEVDKWIFNPKGRMIVYGAVTALSGIILANTKGMIENLKSDIEKIDGVIKGLEERQTNSSNYFEKGLNSFLSMLTEDANASKLQTSNIGTKLPCIQPIKKQKGKCANLKVLHRRFTPSGGYKNPAIMNQAFNTITEIGNGLNGQSKISPQTMNRIENLAQAKPILLGIKNNVEKIVNNQRRATGAKPLNFKGLHNLFLKRLYKQTEKVFKKHNVSERDIASLTSGSIKQSRKTHQDRKLVPNLDNMDDLNLKNDSSLNYEESSKLEARKSDHSSSNHSYEIDQVNKDKFQDIFKIISRRYYMIRKSRIGQ